MGHMALIDPKDADNIYNESDWAARRKEARECLIGYLISAEDAKNRYNIEPRKGKTEVVYLEHWTETEFRIVVDNRVPSVPGYGPFEGVHQIGRTPIVYVPHIPD